MIDIQDCQDLKSVAHRYWPWAKLVFALKSAMLAKYGTPVGLVLQEWDDEDWYSDDCGCEDDCQCSDVPDVFATHYHILREYTLLDFTFHEPTDEFLYVQWRWGGISKESPHFAELRDKCTSRFKGRATKRLSNDEAWRALKRLVKRHAGLLR